MLGSLLYQHLRDFSQGNEAARNAFWEELWRVFQGRLVQRYHYLGPADAEDLASEVIETVVERACRRAVEYVSQHKALALNDFLWGHLWGEASRLAKRIIEEKKRVIPLPDPDRERSDPCQSADVGVQREEYPPPPPPRPGHHPEPVEEAVIRREAYRDYLEMLGFQDELLRKRHPRARAVGELQEYLITFVQQSWRPGAETGSLLGHLSRDAFVDFLRQQGKSKDWIEHNLKRRRELLARYEVYQEGMEPWLYPRSRGEESC